MDTPPTPNLRKRASRLTAMARTMLFWETYAPVFALGVLIVCVFIMLAAFGLWQRIGDPWRLVALLGALGALGYSAWQARAKTVPNQSDARRRIEDDAGLLHRPLDTISDRPAPELLASSQARAVWDEHIRRASAAVTSAPRPRVRPALAPIDKYYLRLAVPAALIVAFMVGAGDNYERVRAALSPSWQAGMAAGDARYEAWVDPPAYTARPPGYFKDKSALRAPEGSEFVARISGVKTAPRLIVREDGRTRRITPKRLGAKSFEARTVLSKTATAHYRIGAQTKSWNILIGEDKHPVIKFDSLPEPGKRDRLLFSYSLEDDYGVQALTLVLALKETPDIKDEISINLPGYAVRSAESEPASLDLTKHKWAGKNAVGYLVAVDGKGQVGASGKAYFVIPDKIFVEQLAKAVAEQRTYMIADQDPYAPLPRRAKVEIEDFEDRPLFAVDEPSRAILRAPASVQRASLLIETVTDKPAGVFADPAVYMGLRNVYRRLQTAPDRAALSGIDEDLWAIALRAEFGRLGDALEDMRAAERALNNAMARRAPQREVDALFDRYNAAVERYIEELTLKAIEEAKKNGPQDGGDGGEGGDGMNTDEIEELLAAIEEANRMGDTAAARKALARLAELLENMQIQMAQGGGSGQGVGGGMSEQLKDALEELSDLMGDQRELRDETRSAEREDMDEQAGEGQANSGQPKPGEGSAKSPQQLAQDQAALQDLLSELEGNVGGLDGPAQGQDGDETGDGGSSEEGTQDGAQSGGGGDEEGSENIGKALRGAGEAMRESQDALKDGDFYAAGRAQSKAIDALREAGEGLIAQEAQRLSDKDSETGSAQNGDGEGDPFGRENDGSGVGDEVEIPPVDDRQRAKDLLDELRRRSGQQERDQIERDYLERLLERF